MKLLNNILKLNCLLLFLFITEVIAEYRFSGDCYLFYTDSVEYSEKATGQDHPPNILVPGFLCEYQNLTRKKYANYIFTFATSDLKISNRDSIFLVFKAVGGADKTLLNGKIIGETGTFPPNYRSYFGEERIYYIPNSLLQKQNQVKVVLYSPNNSGGIFGDPPYIYSNKELKQFSQRPQIATTESSLLPFSNGIASAAYNPNSVEFTHFYPHIYAEYNEASKTPLVLDQLVPVVYRGGIRMNLKDIPIKASYIPGTGILHLNGRTADFNLSIFGLSPFSETQPLWIFYLLLEGPNLAHYSLDFTPVNPAKNLIIHKDGFTNTQQKWLRLIIHHKAPGSSFSSMKYKNLNNNFSILQRELKWWRDWHTEADIPTDISEKKLTIYLQSLVMIKMAQSREEFPAKGQIISSLLPGNNRTNLLDQAIIIEGLLHSGHNREALNCLQFLMRGKCGKHRNLTLFGNNLGLFNQYALSSHNYFGNSVEKPINRQHPVISLGGFGLVLTNIRHYLKNTEDRRFLEYYWEKIYREIALVLVNLIDETGLIREDSGSNEFPLPGKHFTATSALVYKGLVDAAWMARSLGQETAAQEFEFYANKIRISIQNRLFDKTTSTVRAALEGRTKDTYIDATISSLINYIFTSQDEISNAVLKTLNKELLKAGTPLVFARYEYDYLEREISIYDNLRYAESLYNMNRNDQAEAILQKILTTSHKNHRLLPDRISSIFGTPIGTGSIKAHAAYLKTIHTRN